MEDIINRGGGNVLIRVYNSTKDEDLDKVNDVHVHVDGREMVVPAGTQVRLTPGESISIYPYMYHDFEVEEGTGPVLLGEVSTFPPPRLMISSILDQWKCIGEFCPSLMYRSFSA